VAAIAGAAIPLAAQDTTAGRGVHIGMQYTPGIKPNVLVLAIPGDVHDSVRTIIERDLDFGDRVTIIPNAGGQLAAGGTLNFSLYTKLAAAAVVQGTLGPAGLHAVVYDVAHAKPVDTRDLPLSGAVGSPEWRLAIHGAADQIERSITGVQGIAATRVAYVRSGQIYEIDSDGLNARALTGPGLAMSPAWHPTGRYIVYNYFAPKGTLIGIVDVTTHVVHAVPATPWGLNSTPVFSPDGNSIVYTHGEENGTDLYLAPAFTNAPGRRITVGKGTDNTQPAFSPDGKRIAFTSGRLGHPEVYITDVDGTDAELLTPFEYGDEAYRASADWSPDGRLIAYQSRVAGDFQVMTIALRDRGVRQLTSDAINTDPSWAPDSRHMVFTSTRTGAQELFVIDAESGRTRQLTHGGGARLAAWSRALPPLP
jgi:TolB protein